MSQGVVPSGRMLGNDDPHNFAKLGRDYLADAKILCAAHTTESPTWPTYQLAFQALENLLKAYLLAHGASMEQIRKKVGHNVCKALGEAKAKGLKVTGHEHSEDAVMVMGGDYAAHDFRYTSVGQWEQVHPALVIAYVEAVGKAVGY